MEHGVIALERGFDLRVLGPAGKFVGASKYLPAPKGRFGRDFDLKEPGAESFDHPANMRPVPTGCHNQNDPLPFIWRNPESAARQRGDRRSSSHQHQLCFSSR
jgi:hypothetical protein